LDDSLFQHPGDSLVMLYRSSTAKNWHSIPFTKIGTTIGYIYIDNVLPGEYTLACWDEAYVGISELNVQNKNNLHISPNPGTLFQIDYKVENPAKLMIRGIDGNIVYNQMIDKGSGSISWNAGQFSSGVYFVQLTALNGSTLEAQKIVVNPRK
jgi:hypothetical protein